jgi:hypothetical protein
MEPIINTFVLIAPDSRAAAATAPPPRGTAPTVASIQHELLTARPYSLTLEDLIFATHARRSGLSEAEAKLREAEIRAELFAKPHPCMRASPLPKTYGWGVHHDSDGRIALYGVETEEYRRFASGAVEGIEIVAAMRSKREK